ncbi:retrovirus-related pol polyprotein from transposon TNT 1-94 [Tanacetum coccineum]
MRLFGCPVTILNTIDHLGKFDGKADEGFCVGYSINSKAFRVFNSRTRIVKENLHVQFSENIPNIAGSRPNWLFDIDALTKLMNYKPVVIGNQSNGNAGTKACDDEGKARMETVPGKDYILLPLWTVDPPFSLSFKEFHDAGFKPSGDDEKKVTKEPRKEGGDSSKDGESYDQENEDNVNSTNTVNATSINEVNVVGVKTSIKLLDDPNMPELEDIVYLDDDEDVGAEADMNNLDAFMPVWTLVDLPNGKRPIGTKWVYRNKKDVRGIVIKNKARLVSQGYTQEEGIDYDEVFALIEEEVLGLSTTKDSKSTDFLTEYTKYEKATLWTTSAPSLKSLCTEFKKMMHKKFQMSSIGELTFFLVLQVKQKEDGNFISQDKYVTEILKKFGFIDVKTASTPMETQKPFLKDEDGEELDVYLYRSMIGSLMYLTSLRPDIMFAVCACTRYQVNPKVSHLHAVKRIFRYLKGQPKLGLWYPKDSPLDLLAYTDSDYAGASLDMKSTTGVNAGDSKLMLLGINLLLLGKVNAARHKLTTAAKPTESEGFEQIVDSLNAHTIRYALTTNATIYTSCIQQFWATIRAKTINGEVQLQALVDGKKVIITKEIVRRYLQLEDAEGVECLSNAINFEELTRMGSKRKDTQIPQSSGPTYNDEDEAVNEEMDDSLVRATTTATGLNAEQDRGNINKTQSKATPNEPSSLGTSSGGGPRRQDTTGDTIAQTRFENVSKTSSDPLLARENTNTTQAQEITILKLRVKRLEKKGGSRTHKLKRLYKVGRSARVVSSDEASLGDHEDESKQGRKINDIDADAGITLDSTYFNADTDMFRVHDLDGDEVVVESEVATKKKDDKVNVVKEVVSAAEETVNAATITKDGITLAQALAELKSVKPKVTTTTTTTK